ncbi:hypothetical protein DERP_011458 [Dermatophagoides pteronyssinus]|uniref:Uncharacterized protein n=1 Tax=Dermatophagoides pteronyssinus TaxID=6956 RepID=A0ABQ8J5H2_DERPT|nr:hypothetical protein DERP_011458 [Dermatophagoides pteronyssinus]
MENKFTIHANECTKNTISSNNIFNNTTTTAVSDIFYNTRAIIEPNGGSNRTNSHASHLLRFIGSIRNQFTWLKYTEKIMNNADKRYEILKI